MDGYRSLARLGLIVGLVGVEVVLAHHMTSSTGFVGYTQTSSHTVAPPRRAKVKTIAVQLGDPVTAGQLIAELDATDVDNEIEAARTARSRAVAALQAAMTKLRMTSVDVERRFQSSTEKATADLVSADANAKTAAAELDAIEHEIEEQAALVKDHLADGSQLKSLQLRKAALSRQVASAEKVLAVLRDNLNAATKRAAGLENPTGDETTLAPLQAELEATDVRLRQLERERAALVLQAPVDGVIDQLPLHPGDLAAPETPVATVVAADTTRVVACIPESRGTGIAVGQEAELTTVFDRVSGSGFIESLTSEIAPLPARCQLGISKVAVMGRLAVVALDGPSTHTPGQTQLIKFRTRRRPIRTRTTPAASSASPAAAPTPVQMQVPKELLEKTRFEPSGLVWVKALDRYVIVSDDTGFEKDNEHAPWLFTMNARGVVDGEPVIIDGVDKVGDLEGIAADKNGTLWVLSSSSMSKKGKRSAARQRLLRLELNGGKLRAVGSAELADLLERANPTERTALGIGDTRDLDFEGIAAHEGSLYIGLKAPVDPSSRALIWKIDAPDRLLAGDLAGSHMNVWTKLKLSVEADGYAVAGGIADMTFVGSTLLVTATASGLDPKTQSGVLYVVRGDEATRIRAFDGLKPEGIAVSPDTTKLAIAFDCGSDAAKWLELPLEPILREGVRVQK